MKIKELTVRYSRSIQVDDFKYYKPEFGMMVSLDENENPEGTLIEMKALVREELQNIINDEKFTYNIYKQSTQLQAVMNTNEKSTQKYKNAQAKLQELKKKMLERFPKKGGE